MAEIVRNRTIRPSTRLEESKSYKVDTGKVSRDDILVVNIGHESEPFRKSFPQLLTTIFHRPARAKKNFYSKLKSEFGT